MNKPKREDYATAADFNFWMCAWQHDEIERLRQELRRPMGCTYDSEGRRLTVCHELATLRAILAEARARLVDAYGERCAEFDQDCDGCQTWGLIDQMDAAFAGTAGQLATDRDGAANG